MASFGNSTTSSIPFHSLPHVTESAFNRIHPNAPNTNFLPPSGILDPTMDLHYSTNLSINSPAHTLAHEPHYHCVNNATPLTSLNQSSLFGTVPYLFPGINQQSTAKLLQPSRTLYPPQVSHYIPTYTQTGVGVGAGPDHQHNSPAFSIPSLADESIHPQDTIFSMETNTLNTLGPSPVPLLKSEGPSSLLHSFGSSIPSLPSTLSSQSTSLESITNQQEELLSQFLFNFENELDSHGYQSSPLQFDHIHDYNENNMNYVNHDTQQENRHYNSTLNRTQLDSDDDMNDSELFDFSFVQSPTNLSSTFTPSQSTSMKYSTLKKQLKQFNMLSDDLIIPSSWSSDLQSSPNLSPQQFPHQSYPQFLFHRAKELYQSTLPPAPTPSSQALSQTISSTLYDYLHNSSLPNLFPTTSTAPYSSSQWAYSPFADSDEARSGLNTLINSLTAVLGVQSIPLRSFDSQVTFLSLWDTGLWVPSVDFPNDLIQPHYFVIPPSFSPPSIHHSILTQHDDLSAYPVMLIYSPFKSPRYFAITDYSYIEINPARHANVAPIHNFLTPIHNTISRAIFQDICIYHPQLLLVIAQPITESTSPQSISSLHISPLLSDDDDANSDPNNPDLASFPNAFILPKLQILQDLHNALQFCTSQPSPLQVHKPLHLKKISTTIDSIFDLVKANPSCSNFHISIETPPNNTPPPLSNSCILFLATMLKQVDIDINNMLSAMSTAAAQLAIQYSFSTTHRTPLLPQANIITPPTIPFAYQHPYTISTRMMLQNLQHLQFHNPSTLSPYLSSHLQLNSSPQQPSHSTLSATQYLLHLHSNHFQPSESISISNTSLTPPPTFVPNAISLFNYAQNKSNRYGDPLPSILTSFTPTTVPFNSVAIKSNNNSLNNDQLIGKRPHSTNTNQNTDNLPIKRVILGTLADQDDVHFSNILAASCIPYDLLTIIIRSELRQTGIFREGNNDYYQTFGISLRLPEDIQFRYIQSKFLSAFRNKFIPRLYNGHKSFHPTTTRLNHPSITHSLFEESSHIKQLVTATTSVSHSYGTAQSFQLNTLSAPSTTTVPTEHEQPFLSSESGFTSHAYSYLHVHGPNNRSLACSIISTPNTEIQTQLLHEVSNQAELVGISQPFIDPIRQIIPTQSTHNIDQYLRILNTYTPKHHIDNIDDDDDALNNNNSELLSDLDVFSIGDSLSTQIYARSTRQCILFDVRVTNIMNSNPHISSMAKNYNNQANFDPNLILKSTSSTSSSDIFLPIWMPHVNFVPIAEINTPIPILDFQINPTNAHEAVLLLKDGRINFWDSSSSSTSHHSNLEHEYHNEFVPGYDANLSSSPSTRLQWEDCQLIDLWWLGSTQRQLNILSQLHPVNDYNMYLFRHGLYFNPIFDEMNRLFYLQNHEPSTKPLIESTLPHFHAPLSTLTRPPFPGWGKLQYSQNPSVLFGALPHSLWNIDRRINQHKKYIHGYPISTTLLPSLSTPIPLNLTRADRRIFDIKVDHEHNPYHLAISTAAHVYLYDTRNFSSHAASWPIPSIPVATRSFNERSLGFRSFDDAVTPEIRQISFTHTYNNLNNPAPAHQSMTPFVMTDIGILDTIPIPQTLTIIQPLHAPLDNFNTDSTTLVGYTTTIPSQFLSSYRLVEPTQLTKQPQQQQQQQSHHAKSQSSHRFFNATFLLHQFAHSFIHIAALHQPRQWLLEYTTISPNEPSHQQHHQQQQIEYNTQIKPCGNPIPIHIPVTHTTPSVDDYIMSWKTRGMKELVARSRSVFKKSRSPHATFKLSHSGLMRHNIRLKQLNISTSTTTGSSLPPITTPPTSPTSSALSTLTTLTPQSSTSSSSSQFKPFSITALQPFSKKRKKSPQSPQSPRSSFSSQRPVPPQRIPKSSHSRVQFNARAMKKTFRIFASSKYPIDPLLQSTFTLPQFHHKAFEPGSTTFSSPTSSHPKDLPQFTRNDFQALDPNHFRAQLIAFQWTRRQYKSNLLKIRLLELPESDHHINHALYHNKLKSIQQCARLYKNYLLRTCRAASKKSFSRSRSSQSSVSSNGEFLDGFVTPKISRAGFIPKTSVPTVKMLTPQQRAKTLVRPPFTITTSPLFFPQRIPFTYIPISIQHIIPQSNTIDTVKSQHSDCHIDIINADNNNTLVLATTEYSIIRIPTIIYQLIFHHIFNTKIHPTSTQNIPLRPYCLNPLLSTLTISFHSQVKQSIHSLHPHLSLQPQTVHIEFNILHTIASLLFKPFIHHVHQYIPQIPHSTLYPQPHSTELVEFDFVPRLYSLNSGKILDPNVHLVQDCMLSFEQPSQHSQSSIQLQTVPSALFDLSHLAHLLLFSYLRTPTQQYALQKRPWFAQQIIPQPLYSWPQLASHFDNLILDSSAPQLCQFLQRRFQPLLSTLSLLKMVHFINSMSSQLLYELQAPLPFANLITLIYSKIQSALFHFNTALHLSTPSNHDTEPVYSASLFEIIPPQFLQLEFKLSTHIFSKWISQHESSSSPAILPFFHHQLPPTHDKSISDVDQMYFHFYSTPATLIFRALRLFIIATAFNHFSPPSLPSQQFLQPNRDRSHAQEQIIAYHMRQIHLTKHIHTIYSVAYPEQDFDSLTVPLPSPLFDLYFIHSPLPSHIPHITHFSNSNSSIENINENINALSCLCDHHPNMLQFSQKAFPQRQQSCQTSTRFNYDHFLRHVTIPFLCPLPHCITLTTGLFMTSIPTLPPSQRFSSSSFSEDIIETTGGSLNPFSQDNFSKAPTQVLSQAFSSSTPFSSSSNFSRTSLSQSHTPLLSFESYGSTEILSAFSDYQIDTQQETNQLVFNTLMLDDDLDDLFSDPSKFQSQQPQQSQQQSPQQSSQPGQPFTSQSTGVFVPSYQPQFDPNSSFRPSLSSESYVESFFPIGDPSAFDIAHPSQSYYEYSQSTVELAYSSSRNLPTQNSFAAYCNNESCSPFQLGINGASVADAASSAFINSLAAHLSLIETLAFDSFQ